VQNLLKTSLMLDDRIAFLLTCKEPSTHEHIAHSLPGFLVIEHLVSTSSIEADEISLNLSLCFFADLDLFQGSEHRWL
jgi:hypothetical protein